MAQEYQEKPWLFHLLSDGRDIVFRRVPVAAEPTVREDGQNEVPWALHGEQDPNAPAWKVLIFVKANVPGEEIMHEINKAQIYWREQTERKR